MHDEKAERNSHYDKYKRNKESRAFYKSKAWEQCRHVVLIRDNYLCQECFRKGKLTPAVLVHHIKELADYPELALDPGNLESLCNPCHNKEHPDRAKQKPKEAGKRKKMRVVKSKANEEVL